MKWDSGGQALSLCYKSSLINDCVFYKGKIIFMVYVKDGIFLGPGDQQLTQAIRDIQNAGLNIKDQDHPADSAWVNIEKAKDGSYMFSQRALINSIIQDVGLTDKKTKPVPAKVVTLLHAHRDEPVFNLSFNYCPVVGKLNYLAQTTHPGMMYLCTRLPSSQLIQGSHMERQSCTLSNTSRNPVN